MYEPSRNLLSFHIAGFQFWDGATVLGELKAGDRLRLVPEPDNPHDASAVAIYAGQTKLGYVPGDCNEWLSVMLHYGHGDAFECVIQQVAPERSPWHQVRVGVFAKDARVAACRCSAPSRTSLEASHSASQGKQGRLLAPCSCGLVMPNINSRQLAGGWHDLVHGGHPFWTR